MLVIRYLAEQVRETLPDSDETAGAWVSGLAYGCLLNWALLILATWAWLARP